LKVPFFRLKFSRAEKKSIRETLDAGWVTTGPRAAELEDRVREITGARYAVALSSCTAALHLSLKAVGVGQGDEVVTTPNTMAATIEAILYCGAKPVLADIDPVTQNIDPSEVEPKITCHSKAILAVDFSGLPCDYRRLKKIARKSGLFLIADAAHAFGAEYEGKRVGSIADITAFSFYPTKPITTGEGGMAVTDSGRWADRIRRLSLHAMTSSGRRRYAGGSWKYDVTDLGFKYNLSDLAAALGVGQLSRFHELAEKRRKLAGRYQKNLAGLADMIQLPYAGDNCIHARHLFVIRLNLDKWRIGRERFIDELEKAGVGCGVHFIPVYRFTYYARIPGCDPKEFPACEDNFKRIVSLPLYPDLSFSEVDFVCEKISRLARKYSR
jgi:dTDP-4-amino-4,6-dideoxygalactose transaminase